MERWLPIKIISEENNLLCRWLFIGNKKFVEPFFDETILHCRASAENHPILKSVSSLEQLGPWCEQLQSIKPTAFIFHVSRCGSTLISQFLSLDPKNIVLSEVPFLDDVLRLPFQDKSVSEEQSNEYFTCAMRFYGQQKEESESRLFIKLDSWHLLFLDRIRKCFPTTPFLILYRSPAEVIRSQQHSRGMQSVPGLIEKEIFGFEDSDMVTNLDLYMTKVLEKYFIAIISFVSKDSNILLTNYNEGMMQILDKLLERTGVTVSETIRTFIESRAAFDAKRPAFFFQPEEEISSIPTFLETAMLYYKQVEEFKQSLKTTNNKFQKQN